MTHSSTARHTVAASDLDPVLRISDLTLIRRRQTLVSDLFFAVPAGDTIAVMGRSGAGKTTLLNTIAGLAEPDGGTLLRPPGRIPVVFQDPRLLPWRTVVQNIELVLEAEEKSRALEWLTTVGLADVADSYPLTLSGGMRQRVAIARALACHTPLLLVDEPFAHLDLVTATVLRRELREHIAASGSAVVWVTHDPAEAAEVASRTLMMTGPPDGAWTIIDHADYSNQVAVTDALTALLHDSGTTTVAPATQR